MRRMIAPPFVSLLLSISLSASDAVWLDVPFVKQDVNGCGAASIAMLMQYWARQSGRPSGADAAAIQRALYSRDARGIYASAMEKYLQQNGFQTFVLVGAWSDLQHHLEKGRPLIAAIKPAGEGVLHYVVVAGIDKEILLLNDPARRKLLKYNRSDFEREWKATSNWTLLALPRSATP
jgi:ABC-type bacteriocin/lantibiotic exporter with double-glycine peptidase domain